MSTDDAQTTESVRPVPFYEDDLVTLYHGRFEDVLPALGLVDVVIVTDPPYGETSLSWDRWPVGWPAAAAAYSRSMWVFGSLRMFLNQRDEFAGWKLSQDVVWEKHNGTSMARDRFKRVHEHALHWYRGKWSEIRHETPTTPDATARQVRRKQRPGHWGTIDEGTFTAVDGGPRLMRSVLFRRSMHGKAINETEKPVDLVLPLVEYAAQPGDIVLDLFAGSGSTLVAARSLGIRSIGIEERLSQCEKAAKRLSVRELDLATVGAAPSHPPAVTAEADRG